MADSEDAELKPRPPVAGRRASSRQKQEEEVGEDSVPAASGPSGDLADDPPPRAQKAKTGGWSMDAGDSGPTESSSVPADSDAKSGAGGPKHGRRVAGASRTGFDAQGNEEDESTAKHKRQDSKGSDDMPVIPDLEEELEEDITRQVAAPPKHKSTKVQSLKDLDAEFKFSLPGSDATFDLSLLTSVLMPQEMVMEEDVAWEYDTLLADVSMEIEAERERLENEAAEASGEPKKEPSKAFSIGDQD